ncbi:MAG TPA: diguanylate cyclase [Rhodobacteraceae bacterium]|nr:diguanylate cyclase [Paracoccaceae bacterium]
MQIEGLTDWLALAALCLITAGLASWLLAPRRGSSGAANGALAAGRAPVLLFDGDRLLDATAPGRALVPGDMDGSDWQGLRQALAERFPDLPPNPPEADTAPTVLGGARAGESLTLEQISGITRLELHDARAQPTNAPSREAETLRMALDDAPYPAWQVDDEGRIGQFNAAYRKLLAHVHGKQARPDAPLFTPTFDPQAETGRERVAIDLPDGDTRLWYDVSMVRHDGFRQFFATDINAVVSAEIAQRNFVQTLAKTFAQLSIGLAIFDRNRQLALFNPALIDLTNLPADFLSARPNLLTFFDRLRDNRVMPEPKNYGSWRHQMADLVAAADDGRYQETWSLASGSVYSVSGRPHPDGAVAFLFEDITAEVTLTRRFRSDVELGQSILDRLDTAIAVFSPSGVLTLANRAYRDLWGVDPDGSFAEVSVQDCMRVWQDRCAATPVWGEIRDFLGSPEARTEWGARVVLSSGETLDCTVSPVHSGATMVSFARTETRATGAARRMDATLSLPD